MASQKKMGPKGMILLARGNRILEETVRDQLIRDEEEKRQTLLDVKLCDFDEVSYNISIKNEKDKDDAPLVVSIGCPCYGDIKATGTDEALKDVFGDRLADAQEGYDVSVAVDLASLPTEEKVLEKLVMDLSYLKYHTMSGPFRKYCKALESDSPLTEKFKFDIRSDTTVYIIPSSDRVTVVFGVDYQDKVDKVLAGIFMQELVDARKRIRTAPPFAWGQAPPAELVKNFGLSENPGILGFATIALMKAHVSGAKQVEVISALINFRSFLQYHLKCAKSFFHSRMRARCSDLLKILNRAKVKFGETQKKTKSGKTFTRH